MARYLYINPDPASQARATELGCGWMQIAPAEFLPIAVPPCVIVNGAGQSVVLPEPTTAAAVTSAAQGIVAAETAIAQSAATQAANTATLQSKAQAALAANATFQTIASPTSAQTLAQVQLLTKECNALIRLMLSLFDSTAGT